MLCRTQNGSRSNSARLLHTANSDKLEVPWDMSRPRLLDSYNAVHCKAYCGHIDTMSSSSIAYTPTPQHNGSIATKGASDPFSLAKKEGLFPITSLLFVIFFPVLGHVLYFSETSYSYFDYRFFLPNLLCSFRQTHQNRERRWPLRRKTKKSQN